MKEIGSEFWSITKNIYDNGLDFLKIGADYKLLMSGRTSIDYVLGDFYDKTKIVYMPNYCCESMLQPFLDNGYQIIYYDIDMINNQYNINTKTKCSVFFAMSYFGYSDSKIDNFIEQFSKNDIIVIEDITHRLMCNNNYCANSNYLIGSLRKWFPIISGGIAIKISSKFNKTLDNYSVDADFVKMKTEAMNMKKDYIEEKTENKNQYLELFKKTNNCFLDYKRKKIDNESLNILKNLNIEEIKKRRISNSLLIEQKLSNNKNIKLMYKYKKGDCPLFVPILIENRDYVRKKLIEKNIYLPIHWQNSKLDNRIYNMELSLINDQRYKKEEIEKYIDELIKIVGE